MTNFNYNSYIPLKDKDLNEKTISEFIFQDLICYDYYEEYQQNKKYITDEYQFEYYPNIKRKYINKLITYYYHTEYKYVVAYEILNEYDKNILKKYCQCKKHKYSIFNPVRYFIGEFDVGCINSDFPTQFVIWKTRLFIKNYIDDNNIHYPI
jgi:hypothetical protein